MFLLLLNVLKLVVLGLEIVKLATLPLILLLESQYPRLYTPYFLH